jgi:glycosyltransferase involved in cell wall biosynthesis
MLKIDISVVITCYSEGQLIFDAINSIYNQSILPLEIIIVNDASSHQETVSVCRELEQNPEIKLIWRTSNGGPAIARNDGFRVAKGAVLVPLDADDILPERALEYIWTAFLNYPDAGFIYSNYERQDQPEKSELINPGDISLERMLSAKSLSLSSQWTLIGTAPLRRSLWESLGACDPTLGAEDLHDLEFWIRAIASGCHYYYIPEVIYIWRRYLGSNSRRVTPLSWYRIAKKHFAVYRQVGLEYRAYELLLLGSKWLNHPEEINLYSQKLWECIIRGQFKFPTLIALLIPPWLFRKLAAYAGKRR